MLVLEDLHWADEATLDVLRLLARRIETRARPSFSPATATTSSTAATRFGSCSASSRTAEAVERLKTRAALAGGGRALAEPHGVDADQLYRKTDGNPFFVTEVLAAGEE